MRYRIKEIKITPTYSDFKIQRKFLCFWFTITVDERYLLSLGTARSWIRLKTAGMPVHKYYYE